MSFVVTFSGLILLTELSCPGACKRSINNVSSCRKLCHTVLLPGAADATCHMEGSYNPYVWGCQSCQLVLWKFIAVPNWFSLIVRMIIHQELTIHEFLIILSLQKEFFVNIRPSSHILQSKQELKHFLSNVAVYCPGFYYDQVFG